MGEEYERNPDVVGVSRMMDRFNKFKDRSNKIVDAAEKQRKNTWNTATARIDKLQLMAKNCVHGSHKIVMGKCVYCETPTDDSGRINPMEVPANVLGQIDKAMPAIVAGTEYALKEGKKFLQSEKELFQGFKDTLVGDDINTALVSKDQAAVILTLLERINKNLATAKVEEQLVQGVQEYMDANKEAALLADAIKAAAIGARVSAKVLDNPKLKGQLDSFMTSKLGIQKPTYRRKV
jgi:hypothetical protein